MSEAEDQKELLELIKQALSGVDFDKIQEKYQFGGNKRSFWAAGITVDYNAYPIPYGTGMDHRIIFRTFSSVSGSSVIIHYTKLPEGRCLVTDLCINTTFPGSASAVIISYCCARSIGVWQWELSKKMDGASSVMVLSSCQEAMDEIIAFIAKSESVLQTITLKYIGKDKFRASV